MKSKTSPHLIHLSDRLWDDLGLMGAKVGCGRAQFIRDALETACLPKGLPKGLPTSVLRVPDPPLAAAVPARAAPPKPRGFRPGSAGQIYRDCFGEPPPGMYDEHGNTIDTPSPDDSIDANEYSDEYGDDTGDEGSEEEAGEPDVDARDARPH